MSQLSPTWYVFPPARRASSSLVHKSPVRLVDLLMEPPSYEEASLHPTENIANIPPPPSYNASLSSPATPPPTYGEAVTIQPILHPITIPTVVTSPHHNAGYIIHQPTHVTVQSGSRPRTLSAEVTYPHQTTATIQSAPRPRTLSTPTQYNGYIIHPITQVDVRSPHNGHRQTQSAVVVTQPAPVPVMVTCLRDSPALVRCPHCHHTVTSKTKHVPGGSAWCLCVLIALMGLICGFCLIPFMVPTLQDVHHSCPRCGKPLHVFVR